jgi:AraC-like DNA-binding protein
VASTSALSREFRLGYGESPYGYLMMRRIERAMALLRRGDQSVTEVCFAVKVRGDVGYKGMR